MDTLVIDTDQPVLYEGLLSVGVTLDSGASEKDLLSSNLLVDPNLETFSQSNGVWSGYNFMDMDTTSDSSFSPSSLDKFYGWKVLGGSVSVLPNSTSHVLRISASSNDSVVGVLQKLYGFGSALGKSYTFSFNASSLGIADIYISFVDESLNTCSNTSLLRIQNDKATYQAKLVINKHCTTPHLLIEMKVPEGEPYQVVTDSTTYWTNSRRSTLQIDNLQLRLTQQKRQFGLSDELVNLLDSMPLGFIRYPSGMVANKLYVEDYPVNINDTVHNTSLLPVRSGVEHGKFTPKDLLDLADYIGSSPIYVLNFGFSAPGVLQKVEDGKQFTKRVQYIDYLLASSNNQLGVQLGYNLSSPEYDRRFTQLIDDLQPQHSSLQLIRGGTALGYHKYSDYTEDIVLPKVTFDNLSLIDSILTHRDPYLFPQMVSEVSFDTDHKQGYFLPPLALRAAFLILAEKRTPYINSLGISPLLATEESSDYPLILVSGGRYTPTPLYEYLYDFLKYRGGQLPKDETSDPLSADILVSLSCDEAQGTYYLKAVNITRHPLNYQIKAKGKNSSFSTVEVVSYSLKEPLTGASPDVFVDYERQVTHQNLSLSKSMNYLFAPYEVVFFKFQ